MKKIISIIILLVFVSGCKSVIILSPIKQKTIEIKIHSKDSIKTAPKTQNIYSQTTIKL